MSMLWSESKFCYWLSSWWSTSSFYQLYPQKETVDWYYLGSLGMLSSFFLDGSLSMFLALSLSGFRESWLTGGRLEAPEPYSSYSPMSREGIYILKFCKTVSLINDWNISDTDGQTICILFHFLNIHHVSSSRKHWISGSTKTQFGQKKLQVMVSVFGFVMFLEQIRTNSPCFCYCVFEY